MEIIPAIDLSNGKCVRLTKGKKGTEKVYYENPLEALEFWESRDAKRIIYYAYLGFVTWKILAYL